MLRMNFGLAATNARKILMHGSPIITKMSLAQDHPQIDLP